MVPVEELVAGGHDGVAAGDGGRWRPFGDSGCCGDTNKGKLIVGLPSSSDIEISMLIFGFLIKCLELVTGTVAVLTLFLGAGIGGETGVAVLFPRDRLVCTSQRGVPYLLLPALCDLLFLGSS